MFLIGGGVSSVNLLLELARTDTPYQLNMDLLLGFFGVEKVHDENPYYVSLAMSKLYTKKLSPHQRYEFLKYLFDPTAGESVSRFCAKTRMVRNDDRGSVFRSSPLCPCAGAPSNEKAGDLLTSDSSFAELLQVYSSRVNFCNNDSWKKLMSKVVGFSEQSKIDDILTFSSENQELFRQINKDKNDKIVESSKQFLVRTNAAIAFGIREPEALRLKTKRFHQAMDNLLIPSPSLSLSNEFLR